MISDGATHKTTTTMPTLTPTLVEGKAVKLRASCDACNESKVRCSQTKPTCARCQKQGGQCIYGLSRRSHKTASRVGASSSSSLRQQLELENSSSSLHVDSHMDSHLDSNMDSQNDLHIDSSMNAPPPNDTITAITTTATATTPPPLPLLESLTTSSSSIINWPSVDTPRATSGDALSSPVSLQDFNMLAYQPSIFEDKHMSSQLDFDFMDFAAGDGPFETGFNLPDKVSSTFELHDQSQSQLQSQLQSHSQLQPQSDLQLQSQLQSQSLPTYENNNNNNNNDNNDSSNPSCGSLLRAAKLDTQEASHASCSCRCSSEVVPRLLSTPFLFQDKTVERDVQLSQLKGAIKICEDCIRCECTSSDKLAMLTVGILVGRIVEGFETTLEDGGSTLASSISAVSSESSLSVTSEGSSCPQFSWGVLQIDGEDEANLRQHLWLLHFRKLEAVLKAFNASVRLIRNTQGSSVSSQVMACECIHMWLDQRAQVLRNRFLAQVGPGPGLGLPS